MNELYRPDVYYQKAGGALRTGAGSRQQTDLFGFSCDSNKSGRLMETVGHINRKYQRSTIHLAFEGIDRSWRHAARLKSPNYTGEWNELPVK